MSFFVGDAADIMFGDMKRAILFSLSLITVLVSGWLIFNVLVLPTISVFGSVAVGDSEEALVKRFGGCFSEGKRDGRTWYMHHDAWFGDCAYVVEDGRVIRKFLDK